METFNTPYGIITLYTNDKYIYQIFKSGGYWDVLTLKLLKKYIDPSRNILEIGGHCGTSSIVYASYLNQASKLYVFEPQINMYNLLLKNIKQNALENKIISYNKGVFCYNGSGNMNDIDLDGGNGIVKKRYKEEQHLDCNFGGICLGNKGEEIQLTTIDDMKLDNIGFIHCDAQGSENFIFSHAIKTITNFRPIILFEDNEKNDRYLYTCVQNSYPQYHKESLFNIKKYCIETLKYTNCIENFNGTTDTLLIP